MPDRDEIPEAERQEMLAMPGAFLGFLETQLASRPDLMTAFTVADVAGLDDLLEGAPSGDDVDGDEFDWFHHPEMERRLAAA
jgi:hypothetical protein